MTAGERAPLWLADWSDGEDEDFRWAFASAGSRARVFRTAPLGTSVGSRAHRLRSWPGYASLAARGIARAGGAPIVAWQPLAGALVGLAPGPARSRLVVLNPLLDAAGQGLRQRLVAAGSGRARRVVFFSRAGLDAAVRLGLPRAVLRFVPLGVRARREQPAPARGYLLAAGREARDWRTLALAADGLDVEVRALGPGAVPFDGPLRVLPQVDRPRFLELLDGAIALVVPLLAAGRTAGQLAVLDAMSVGRAVVATRAQGTEDYVRPETGILVPPGDPEALRDALRAVCEPGVAEPMGAAALAAARGPFSLGRFVREVHAEALDTLA